MDRMVSLPFARRNMSDRVLFSGGAGYTLYDSFSGVLLSAGGSGISFVLAIAQELLQRATVAPGSTNTRAIEIVWSIQHPRE